MRLNNNLNSQTFFFGYLQSNKYIFSKMDNQQEKIV